MHEEVNEDIVYLEEDMYTEEDWEVMVLVGEIELRHLRGAGKEAQVAETDE